MRETQFNLTVLRRPLIRRKYLGIARVNGTASEEDRKEREREKQKSVQASGLVLRGTRLYAFAKQADRITRYYDRGFSS